MPNMEIQDYHKTSRKVLGVSHCPDGCKHLKASLEQAGFTVSLGKDVDVHLDVMGSDPLDIVLIDAIISQMDVVGICKKIKTTRRSPYLPVLLLVDAEGRVKCREAGADDYILKPFDISELISRINILIEIKDLQDELKSANQRILVQQKSVIEEERLRLLFQMIGEEGHEMGQPLMALLGTISLIRLKQNDHEKLAQYIDRIERFGYRLSDIKKNTDHPSRGEQIRAW